MVSPQDAPWMKPVPGAPRDQADAITPRAEPGSPFRRIGCGRSGAGAASPCNGWLARRPEFLGARTAPGGVGMPRPQGRAVRGDVGVDE